MIRACRVSLSSYHSVFPRNTGLGTDIFIKLEYIARSLVKIKSIPDWHLFISRMETKWTKWLSTTSHVIAYRSLELLFGTHTFHFNCFCEDFNCVFTQIRCLSRVLYTTLLEISRRGSYYLLYNSCTKAKSVQQNIHHSFNVFMVVHIRDQ